ncbi:MAG: acyltransferase [Planctomycetota bacterium]|nr:acyltransferase [Planctomycetota bacterium]
MTSVDTRAANLSPKDAAVAPAPIGVIPKPGGKLDALESLRGFAAMYVVAGHICNLYFGNPPWTLPFRFAAEAVILFFLLSGFVIRYSTRDDTGSGEYLFKRFRRIYPLFFLSLPISYFLSSYADGEFHKVDVAQLVGNVLMLQDFGYARPGVWVDQFYNDAFWSLSYEWWFYLFFLAVIRFNSRDKPRTVLVGGVALAALGAQLVAPNEISFFLTHFAIWWAGADLAREFRQSGTVTLRRHVPFAVFLALLAGVWAVPLLDMPRSQWAFGLYPIMEMRRFAFAGLALIAGLIYYRYAWNRGGQRLFAWTFGPFKYVAPISYGIYVFHFPILDALKATRVASSALLYIAVSLAAIFALAYFMEIIVQGWINAGTEPMLRRLKAQAAKPVPAPAG